MLWSRTLEPYRLSSHAESGSLANSSSLSCIPHTHHVGRGGKGRGGEGGGGEGEGGKRDTIERKHAKKSNPNVYLGCLCVSCGLSCLLKTSLSLGLQTTETPSVYNTFAAI